MYKIPVILNSDTHRTFKMAPVSRYNFAKGLNSCVVLGQEYSEAAKHYSIVFSRTMEGEIISLALLGINNNLFIEGNGTWLSGAYIPAFVRRYPYILAEGIAEDGSLTVCVGSEYEGFGADDGERLFTDEGENSAALNNSIDFLRLYHEQFRITREFVSNLTELNLFKAVDASITLAGGERFTIRDMSMVDEEALHGLADNELAGLARKGYLSWIYAHLHSIANFSTIINRADHVVPQKKA
jgi:hypothetical protein